MKALVTGVAGFIGSTLAERLCADGADVVGLDCFTDYYPRALKERNLAGLRGQPRFRFVESSLGDADLASLLADRTHVFHLAAQAGVRKSWGRDFNVYTVNNIDATQVLLEACTQQPIERLVYASSSSVYGDVVALPMREDALPQPVSPYGVSKLAAEQLCYLYHVNYGVPAVSLRYFTVYGPRQRPDMGFNRFLRATLRGEPIAVYGDGEQTRDFTFVADAVSATIAAATRGVRGPCVQYRGRIARDGERSARHDRPGHGPAAGDPVRGRAKGRHAAYLRRHVAGPAGSRILPYGIARGRTGSRASMVSEHTVTSKAGLFLAALALAVGRRLRHRRRPRRAGRHARARQVSLRQGNCGARRPRNGSTRASTSSRSSRPTPAAATGRTPSWRSATPISAKARQRRWFWRSTSSPSFSRSTRPIAAPTTRSTSSGSPTSVRCESRSATRPKRARRLRNSAPSSPATR